MKSTPIALLGVLCIVIGCDDASTTPPNGTGNSPDLASPDPFSDMGVAGDSNVEHPPAIEIPDPQGPRDRCAADNDNDLEPALRTDVVVTPDDAFGNPIAQLTLRWSSDIRVAGQFNAPESAGGHLITFYHPDGEEGEDGSQFFHHDPDADDPIDRCEFEPEVLDVNRIIVPCSFVIAIDSASGHGLQAVFFDRRGDLILLVNLPSTCDLDGGDRSFGSEDPIFAWKNEPYVRSLISNRDIDANDPTPNPEGYDRVVLGRSQGSAFRFGRVSTNEGLFQSGTSTLLPAGQAAPKEVTVYQTSF